MSEWPAWWDWELELGPHLFKRMVDRGFNEVELRRMLAHATSLRRDTVPGRWIVSSWRRRVPWEIIVEPDLTVQLLVVITAYPGDP